MAKSPMKIDKSRTSPFVKITIIALALTFVLGVGGAAIVPLLESIANPAPQRATTGTGSKNTSATITAIAGKFSGRIAASDETLKKEPKNYDVLVAQGRAYQDWATELVQLAPNGAAADPELFNKAVEFYKRALAVKATDPNVATDMAVTQFYSGDTDGAIATAEAVVKAYPKFAPVHFNMGVFFGQKGDSARGIAEFQRYVTRDPKGQMVSKANELIAELQKKPAAQGDLTPASPAGVPAKP